MGLYKKWHKIVTTKCYCNGNLRSYNNKIVTHSVSRNIRRNWSIENAFI